MFALADRFAPLLARPGFLQITISFAVICLTVTGPATKAAVVVDPLRSLAPEVYRVPEGEKPPAEIEELEQALERFREQDYDRCWKLLSAAGKKHSYLPPARLMLARFFLIHDLVPPGRVALEQAAVEVPGYPGVYLTFGKLAISEGRVTDASVHFKNVVRLVERGKWSDAQRRGFLANTHAGLASVAELRRDWLVAKTHLANWLKLDPGNGKARRRLGRVLFALGDRTKAYEELQQAAKDDPSLVPAAVAMAWLYTGQGSVEKAAEWMERAVKAAPEDPKVHLAMATWLLQQRNPERAKGHAETAAKLLPEAAPESKQAKLLCGVIARHLKDYPQAERWFDPIYRADPEDLNVRNQLALVLVEQPDEAKRRRALELAEKNVQLHPGSQEALSTAGWVYYRMGRLDEAERSLQAARAKGALRPDTAYFLARVIADRGRMEEVPDLLKPALDSPAPFAFHKEARKLFNEATEPVP